MRGLRSVAADRRATVAMRARVRSSQGSAGEVGAELVDVAVLEVVRAGFEDRLAVLLDPVTGLVEDLAQSRLGDQVGVTGLRDPAGELAVGVVARHAPHAHGGHRAAGNRVRNGSLA